MEWLIDTFRENERFPAKTRRREVGVRSKTGYNSSTAPEHLRTVRLRYDCYSDRVSLGKLYLFPFAFCSEGE